MQKPGFMRWMKQNSEELLFYKTIEKEGLSKVIMAFERPLLLCMEELVFLGQCNVFDYKFSGTVTIVKT